jgi:hypothetical protein
MNIIALGDIHNNTVSAQKIVERYENTHKIVCVGDYFDSFTGDDAEATAYWLKDFINKPNTVALIGNHDLPYSPYGKIRTHPSSVWRVFYPCSGYTSEKDEIINSVLTKEDWAKVKTFHYENGWLFTHAGVHPYWFEHPVIGMTIDHVIGILHKTEDAYRTLNWTPILGEAGIYRGGRSKVGGILWHDHQREAEPIQGINQIYGHTPLTDNMSNGINVIREDDGCNVCIDCGLEEVLQVYEDGKLRMMNTDIPNFYFHKKEVHIKKLKECMTTS